MPILVALGLIVSDKIFKDLEYFSVLLLWQPDFLKNTKKIQEILKRTMAGTFLRNIIKIGRVVSKKNV